MIPENHYPERRKYTRFKVRDCSFALHSRYGPIVDISLDGLAFLYVQSEQGAKEPVDSGMLFSGATLCCDKVPVRGISDQVAASEDLPLRRRGLQFADLNQEQYARLESFIVQGYKSGPEKMKPTYEELVAKVSELEREIAETQQGDKPADILLVCSYCKKIKDEIGNWQKIETFVYGHYGIKFSHGICPECSRKYYPNLFNK